MDSIGNGQVIVRLTERIMGPVRKRIKNRAGPKNVKLDIQMAELRGHILSRVWLQAGHSVITQAEEDCW